MKRLVSLLIILGLSFSATEARLFLLASESSAVSDTVSQRTKTVAVSRGYIYDRNFFPLTKNGREYIAVIRPTASAVNKIKPFAEDRVINELKKGSLTVLPSDIAKLLPEDDNVKILEKFKRYADDTALHVIGYLDSSGKGAGGIEKYADKILASQGGELNISYSCDALGTVINNAPVIIRDDNYYSRAGIILTIDKKIQEITERALRNSTVEKGAAIVLDCSTAEILACASLPVFDRENIGNELKRTDSPFLNRAFCAYPVGSVFKAVTAAAYIESSSDPLPELFCTGNTTRSGKKFNCAHREGHSKVDFNKAFACSCNTYFIELGVRAGRDALLKTALSLGFSKRTEFGYGCFAASGNLPKTDELDSDAAVANFSFGQGSLTATPVQIAACYCAIANDGIYSEPSLISGTVSDCMEITSFRKNERKRVLSESTCRTLKKAMTEVIKSGTGKKAQLENIEVCGKTATAQTGRILKSGKEETVSWFAGFFPAEAPEYVICILKENGASGGSDDAPVFRDIANGIISLDSVDVRPQ